MIDFMQSVFGTYQPIGDSGINWEYLGSVAIFCIVLWSVLRIVSVIIKK